MKKRIAATLAIVLAFCLALVGCGSSDPKASFVGTWELVSLVQEGETISETDMEAMRQMGFVIYLELNDDDTCTMEYFGQPVEGTWEVKDEATCTVTIGDELVADCILEDGQLRMTDGASALIFAQIDPADKVQPDTSWVDDLDIDMEVEPDKPAA